MKAQATIKDEKITRTPSYVLGREAFKTGKIRRVPVEILEEGIGRAQEWYRGWDKANLAEPLPDLQPTDKLIPIKEWKSLQEKLIKSLSISNIAGDAIIEDLKKKNQTLIETQEELQTTIFKLRSQLQD